MTSAFTEQQLTSCDKEPIHIPGAVQPHGLLLVIDPASGALAAHAGDLGVLGEGCRAEDALALAFGDGMAAALAEIPASGPVLLPAKGLDVVGHRSGDFVVLELERSRSGLTAAAALGSAQALTSRLASAQSLEEVCQAAADAVHEISGYDHVMVYRFLADGTGVVAAEARDDHVATMLNHHFPESDIPRQARELYARNHVRVIPDVAYRPAALQWTGREPPSVPLDMSNCHLRSVSPIHLQYLANMGVAASASISLMHGNSLWGLIACHNSAPKGLDFVERELCKHIGQIVGANLTARLRSATQLETMTLSQRRDEVLQVLIGVGSIEDSLVRHVAELTRAIPSDGVAVRFGDRIGATGSVPDRPALDLLLDHLEGKALDEPYATECIGQDYEPASPFAMQAAGALSIVIRKEPRLSVTWLRAEQVQTINWAGNPHKPIDEVAGVLTPRKSFDLWRQTVEGKARPWSRAEVASAGSFRTAIIEIADHQELGALNRKLRHALTDREELLAQKDILMREVHHRVQNSLQLVNSMLALQERASDDDEVRTQLDRARQRIIAVAMVHKRLWRSDKLGDVRLDSFMTELIDELVGIWGPAWQPFLTMNVAPVTLTTDKSVILGLVVTELLTNAVKYAFGGAPGPLLVEAAEDRGELRIVVADRGIGTQPKQDKQSFGSRLIETLIQQLGGRLAMEDNRPGLRAVLTVPIA